MIVTEGNHGGILMISINIKGFCRAI